MQLYINPPNEQRLRQEPPNTMSTLVNKLIAAHYQRIDSLKVKTSGLTLKGSKIKLKSGESTNEIQHVPIDEAA